MSGTDEKQDKETGDWISDLKPGASTDTKVDKLVTKNKRVTEVHAHFIGEKNRPTKGTLVVKPKRGVVLAAGSIGTPAVLLRSKLNLPNKQVGRHTHIHPVTITIGKYKDSRLYQGGPGAPLP